MPGEHERDPVEGDPVHGDDVCPTTSWAHWEASLADALQALADGGSVTVPGPPEHARVTRPAQGARKRWLLGSRRRPGVPTARFVRVEDHLRGHWSGAQRHDGPFPWTQQEDAVIRDLGWHRPGPTDGEDYVRFWPDDVAHEPYLPRADAARAAGAVARTLRDLLGVTADALPPLLRD